MNNVKLIGSVVKGCEHYYIAHHLKKNDQSILYVGRDDREIFRANLVPLFTFMKQRLKNVDWNYISKSRDEKWGYKRLEPEELFDMLSS